MVNETETTNTTFILSDGVYSKLKFVALVLLPALTTLYFTLGSIWKFPAVESVIGSMTALDTFLGILLGISTKMYNASGAKFDGVINVTSTDGGGKLFSLELNGDPSALDQQKTVTFKVGS